MLSTDILTEADTVQNMKKRGKYSQEYLIASP